MDLRGRTEEIANFPSRPNLRMVAAYSEEEFVTLMRTGKALGNRDLKLMGGVARFRYAKFTDSEINAIYHYLVKLAEKDP